jgi:DNA-binding NtrC family response regulator
VRAKPGRLELAEGGTLFLDEIGDMPPQLQVKFLRVLQERVFERVGGTRTIALDARVIAATHADLSAAVAEGRFRQDLFFRVNVVPIHLPPLRERREDVELLVEHFRRLFLSRSGRSEKRFSEDAMKVLIQYDWPGNVRELINVVEYALAVTAGPVIGPRDLPPAVLNSEMAAMRTLRALEEMAGRSGRTPDSPARPHADPERERLHEALVKHGFRREAAARELGVSRTTLWRLMKTHGLD